MANVEQATGHEQATSTERARSGLSEAEAERRLAGSGKRRVGRHGRATDGVAATLTPARDPAPTRAMAHSAGATVARPSGRDRVGQDPAAHD